MIYNYKLLDPITYEKQQITELEITKPTAKILKKYSASGLSEFKQQIQIASDCTNQPPSLIESLDLDDFMGVVNVITAWFLKAADNKPIV